MNNVEIAQGEVSFSIFALIFTNSNSYIVVIRLEYSR